MGLWCNDDEDWRIWTAGEEKERKGRVKVAGDFVFGQLILFLANKRN